MVDEEASAVREIYSRSLLGGVSCGELASWLNDQGLRTRNTKRLLGPDGSLYQGPRLFTARTVADLLKNRFFTDQAKYRRQTFQGLHKDIVAVSCLRGCRPC